jgi:hypothetical protein
MALTHSGAGGAGFPGVPVKGMIGRTGTANPREAEVNTDMLRNWRAWVLIVLFAGPIVAYMALGMLWLAERRGPLGWRGEWLYYATFAWVLSGVVFAILAHRWTRSQRQLLPPLDWDAPSTFTPLDRAAWDLVQQESETADRLSSAELTELDTYIDTGRRLARRLAAHYNPLSTEPIEHVPVVDLLTALQLAAEDLNELCREVPGGDMITPSHWKRAVQAAGYIQKANEIYTLLLPIFQPAAGLMRLGAQKLMVQPAWKGMQDNLLRWFYRAFINRLGTHLIELYSGRLAIGAAMYRKLTRKMSRRAEGADREPGPMVIAVAGAQDTGKTALIEALDRARRGDLSAVRGRLVAAGFDGELADLLRTARFVEAPGYTAATGKENARSRQTRREAVEQAIDADLLLLLIDAGRASEPVADVRFVEAWQEWFASHPGRETPPAVAVLGHADRLLQPGEPWEPPYDWLQGQRPVEVAVRAAVLTLRGALPPVISDIVPVSLRPDAPYGVTERLLPDLAALLHRAERMALLRHLHSVSASSKAGRLVRQVGRQGRRLWEAIRAPRRARASS